MYSAAHVSKPSTFWCTMRVANVCVARACVHAQASLWHPARQAVVGGLWLVAAPALSSLSQVRSAAGQLGCTSCQSSLPALNPHGLLPYHALCTGDRVHSCISALNSCTGDVQAWRSAARRQLLVHSGTNLVAFVAGTSRFVFSALMHTLPLAACLCTCTPTVRQHRRCREGQRQHRCCLLGHAVRPVRWCPRSG